MKAADMLLAGLSGKLPYKVKSSSATGSSMVNAASVLDSYNGGDSTPGCESVAGMCAPGLESRWGGETQTGDLPQLALGDSRMAMVRGSASERCARRGVALVLRRFRANKNALRARRRLSTPVTVVATVSVIALLPMSALGLEGIVNETNGKPVPSAVIYVVPLAPNVARPAGTGASRGAVMDQYDKEFVPYVLPVQVGTAVTFPNRDNLKHQVYSFSPAKRFELPLYSGIPAKPMVFDKPGPVVLGCNIHDWMLGHIYVVDTPYFTMTGDDGRWKLSEIPEGEYHLFVWHPRMTSSSDDLKRRIMITADPGMKTEPFSLKLGREFRKPRRQNYENLN
jgi:plastocyanin